jgi:GNAT superfamily N-acetyltransferase
MTPDVRIETATAADVPVILRLIRALAAYEKLAHEVVATEDRMRQSLFGSPRRAEVLLAFVSAEPVGFAVAFHTFSTFLGRPGLYLEDLFVLPDWRSRGIGTRLFRRAAQMAVERGCGRMEWAVLDWNETAIAFYKKMGARAMDEWTVYRLIGEALGEAAKGDG